MIEKIDSREQALEYDHEKILEIFETMNKFSDEFLVQKETIDFLTPYKALDTKFPAFNVSGILGTPEMRIQVLEDLL